MRLRNKKTGEMREAEDVIIENLRKNGSTLYAINLEEIKEEWEDYKEDTLYLEGIQDITWNIAGRVIIDYATGKEAERAFERLKAWKRLKNKGFRFTEWYSSGDTTNTIRIYAEFPDAKLGPIVGLDLNLLFGGEDE